MSFVQFRKRLKHFSTFGNKLSVWVHFWNKNQAKLEKSSLCQVYGKLHLSCQNWKISCSDLERKYFSNFGHQSFLNLSFVCSNCVNFQKLFKLKMETSLLCCVYGNSDSLNRKWKIFCPVPKTIHKVIRFGSKLLVGQ